EALKDAGFQINREGKDYISIKDAETGEKLRLKGAIYEQHFTPSRALEIADSAGAGSARKPDIRRANEARRELEAAIQRRTKYNEKRYQVRERPAVEINNQRQDASRGARQQAASDALDRDAVARPANDRAMRADRVDDVAMATDRAIQGTDSHPRHI
ncbi:mobilization protein A, partial [mine drainage metagenome]